jgi:FkbM family methyltransferase
MTPLFDRAVFRRLARRLPFTTRRALKQIALGDRADEADLAYCYRLILGRSPDPDGWRHYRSLIARGDLSVQQLALSFLSSAEYRQRDLARGGAEVTLAAVGPLELYVPSDDAAIGSRMQRRGAYQPHLTGLFERTLAPGMTFVDVGANIGYFSLLAGRIVGETGAVVAIEPGERNCVLLHRSAVRNRLRNIRLHPCAISDRRETLVYLPQGSNGTITGLPGDGEVPSGGRLVPATTLDDLVASLDRVDVIKIDVEGAEARVLRSAAATLERHRPLVVSEFSPLLLEEVSGVTGDAYLAQLLDLGYELSVVDPDGAGELISCGRDAQEVVRFLRGAGLAQLDLVARGV